MKRALSQVLSFVLNPLKTGVLITGAGISLLSYSTPAAAAGIVLPDDSVMESANPFSTLLVSPMNLGVPSGFQEPQYSTAQQEEVLARFSAIDPQKIVPKNLLQSALLFYSWNFDRIPNKNYLTVLDFTKRSTKKRFYIINMNSGVVWSLHVANGSGSEPVHNGYATQFGNTPGSNRSSLGYYLTAEVYDGKHGRSLRMDGLSKTNSEVRDRDIVIHSAAYVQEASVVQGRSSGCFALATEVKDRVVNYLKGGSLIFAGRSGIR